ncbi:hypothetical protein NUW58_g10240 [Xylaria curta]|uniref:Uncharacterized protein n=1 Tax=Xylaria curta TaxID=42375 RepID=A0ACC1MNT7_9PEZI|nr:hypothetical protein NUW58_g10240 [Xylaria curta]
MQFIESKDDLKYPHEHVFLVDCSGIHDTQSEAAYYSSRPIASPDTVAVVTSPNEGLRRWEESTTTVTFKDVGSENETGFTVTLGSRPKDGEIAGNASNTWNTSFACYFQPPTLLYVHENRSCSSSYDCSHADRVLESSSSISSVFPSATDTEFASPSDSSHPQTGVTTGIAMGVTIGIIILAVTTISLLRKYWNQGRPSSNPPDDLSNIGSNVLQIDGSDIYEAGSRAMPAELPGSYVHVQELEAKLRKAETVTILEGRSGV